MDHPPPVDPLLYRQVIGRFATGVTVVTVNVGGELRGMTANAVSSVSLEPTLLLVCVQQDGSLHPLLERAATFAVNILGEEQEELSVLFARRGELAEPMGGVPYRMAPGGAPILEGALGWLECDLHDRFEAGDHTVFLGRVRELAVERADAAPLLFFGGAYHRLAPETQPAP